MIKKTLLGLLVLPALSLGMSAVVPTAPVYAAECTNTSGGTVPTIGDAAGCAQGTDQSGCLIQGDSCTGDETPIFQTITNVLLFIIGAISVIMLIIGGIRYTVSGGDSGAVTSAKNTILYAIVGIVVALLAYALVNFVVGSFVA